MQRIQPLRERLKPLGPVHRKLFLEQLLGSRNILDPGETVILAEIAQSFPVHAAAQPFAAIDANVNTKRQPGLHPRMHPAEFRVYAVVVNRQTGARTDHHVRLVMLECRPISIVLRAHTSPSVMPLSAAKARAIFSFSSRL